MGVVMQNFAGLFGLLWFKNNTAIGSYAWKWMWGELPCVDVVVFKVNMFQVGIFILLLTVVLLILVVGLSPADAFWGHRPVTQGTDHVTIMF